MLCDSLPLRRFTQANRDRFAMRLGQRHIASAIRTMNRAHARLWSVLMIVGMVLAAAPAAAADEERNWPCFRGPRGDGSSENVGLPITWSESENIRWKTPIHGRGWSSPVVWGEQIWLTTAAEDGREMFAICVDRQTGKVLRDIKLFENSAPSKIHDLNSYASPTPLIEEGKVYLHFGSYGTACLDTATGKKLWERRDLPCEHWRGPGSSPISFERNLIVHYDGYDYQYIVALDRTTGETAWKVDRQVDFGTDDGDFKKAFSTPLVIEAAGKTQLISSFSKAAIAYNPRNGDEFWRVRFDGFSSTARPLFGSGLVFINTGFSKADLWAVRPDGLGDVTDSHVIWKATRGIGSKPSSLLIDDLLFVVHDAGVLTCLEAKTGVEVWTKRLGGDHSGSPIFADGRLYIPDHDGKATVVAPARSYQELAVNQFDDGCLASPAVSGRSIIWRTRSHLYRIEKP